MADNIERARNTAVRSIARDLAIDREEAERWCDAWERFAQRQGVPRSAYFWDSARGWIDAQRSLGKAVPSAVRPPPSALEPPVATTRRVDQGP